MTNNKPTVSISRIAYRTITVKIPARDYMLLFQHVPNMAEMIRGLLEPELKRLRRMK